MVDSHEPRCGTDGKCSCRLNCLLLHAFDHFIDLISSKRLRLVVVGIVWRNSSCFTNGVVERQWFGMRRIGTVTWSRCKALVVDDALARAQRARTAGTVAVDHLATSSWDGRFRRCQLELTIELRDDILRVHIFGIWQESLVRLRAEVIWPHLVHTWSSDCIVEGPCECKISLVLSTSHVQEVLVDISWTRLGNVWTVRGQVRLSLLDSDAHYDVCSQTLVECKAQESYGGSLLVAEETETVVDIYMIIVEGGILEPNARLCDILKLVRAITRRLVGEHTHTSDDYITSRCDFVEQLVLSVDAWTTQLSYGIFSKWKDNCWVRFRGVSRSVDCDIIGCGVAIILVRAAWVCGSGIDIVLFLHDVIQSVYVHSVLDLLVSERGQCRGRSSNATSRRIDNCLNRVVIVRLSGIEATIRTLRCALIRFKISAVTKLAIGARRVAPNVVAARENGVYISFTFYGFHYVMDPFIAFVYFVLVIHIEDFRACNASIIDIGLLKCRIRIVSFDNFPVAQVGRVHSAWEENCRDSVVVS